MIKTKEERQSPICVSLWFFPHDVCCPGSEVEVAGPPLPKPTPWPWEGRGHVSPAPSIFITLTWERCFHCNELRPCLIQSPFKLGGFGRITCVLEVYLTDVKLEVHSSGAVVYIYYIWFADTSICIMVFNKLFSLPLHWSYIKTLPKVENSGKIHLNHYDMSS